METTPLLDDQADSTSEQSIVEEGYEKRCGNISRTGRTRGGLAGKIRSRIRILSFYKEGCTFYDRTRILVAGLIAQIPKTLRDRFGIFNEMVCRAIDGVRVERLGFIFYLTALDDLIHTHPDFEREIRDWFDVGESGVFLDVGANIGRYSVSLAGRLDKVYAFEPSSRTFLALVRNVDVNGLVNVHALKIALWNGDGTESFYVKGRSGLGSLVRRDNSIREERITTRALDHLIDDLEIKRIDLVKIDVEGAEKEVLEGMRDTLLRFRPRLIVEVSKRNECWVNGFLGSLGYTQKGRRGMNQLYLGDEGR